MGQDVRSGQEKTMKKNLNYVLITILIILGCVHASMTPVFYKVFDLDALWFAGAGLSFVFLGFINIARIKSREMMVRALCLTGNLMGLVYCVTIAMKLPEPQANIGIVTLFILSILSVWDMKQVV
jgi:hypothetical protein